MSSVTTGWLVFACVFGGALLGMLLRRILPTIISAAIRGTS
jgi:hypothetical protein